MAQTSINIRMDEELKKQAEYLFSEFGMNMTTAFTIFAKAVVREREEYLLRFRRTQMISITNTTKTALKRLWLILKQVKELLTS